MLKGYMKRTFQEPRLLFKPRKSGTTAELSLDEKKSLVRKLPAFDQQYLH
jgi:hypothetical protein